MSKHREVNFKLEEIQHLVDSLLISSLFYDYETMEHLTPLGAFVIALEHILQRDDVLIDELQQLLPPDTVS